MRSWGGSDAQPETCLGHPQSRVVHLECLAIMICRQELSCRRWQAQELRRIQLICVTFLGPPGRCLLRWTRVWVELRDARDPEGTCITRLECGYCASSGQDGSLQFSVLGCVRLRIRRKTWQFPAFKNCEVSKSATVLTSADWLRLQYLDARCQPRSRGGRRSDGE